MMPAAGNRSRNKGAMDAGQWDSAVAGDGTKSLGKEKDDQTEGQGGEDEQKLENGVEAKVLSYNAANDRTYGLTEHSD